MLKTKGLLGSLSGPSAQGRAAMVDSTPGTLEWEDVPGCEPRPGDLLRCLTKWVGSSMWVGEDSGSMDRAGRMAIMDAVNFPIKLATFDAGRERLK